MILGMVGWRGMVGSVLMGRMLEEGDFRHVEKTVFFSTSQAGQPAPEVAGAEPVLSDANDTQASSFPARAAITQRAFTRNCALRAGRVIGLMRRQASEWKKMR